MWGWGGEGDGGMELRTVLWLHSVEVNAGGFCSITLSFACPFALSLPAIPTLRAGQGEKSDSPCKVGSWSLAALGTAAKDGMGDLKYPP